MVFPAAQMSLSLPTTGENLLLKHMALNVASRHVKFETPRSHVSPKTRGIASEIKYGNRGTYPAMPESQKSLVCRTVAVGIGETRTRNAVRVIAVLASLAGSRTASGPADPNLLRVAVTLQEMSLHRVTEKVARLEIGAHQHLDAKAVVLGSLLRQPNKPSQKHLRRNLQSIPSGQPSFRQLRRAHKVQGEMRGTTRV